MSDLQAMLRLTCMEIWSTMFELALLSANLDDDTSWGWWSRVELHGAWEGTVTLYFGDLVGTILCKAMLKIDANSQSTDDVLEVISELANITGGNFKPHLGSPVTLAAPSSGRVTEPPDLSFATMILSFQTLGQPVRVVLCRHA